MPENQLSSHILGPIALLFGGLINVTFGDKELTVGIPSSHSLPAQDPFLFLNGSDKSSPQLSLPWLQAWVPLLCFCGFAPELSPLNWHVCHPWNFSSARNAELPGTSSGAWGWLRKWSRTASPLFSETGAGAEPRKQCEKTGGQGISEICSFSRSPSQFSVLQGMPHSCVDIPLTLRC